MARKLTKAKFKAWLESKHPRTKIGEPGECTSCPIAKFLTQTYPLKKGWWQVNGSSCEIDLDWDMENFSSEDLHSEDFDTPIWAGNFIDGVDSLEGHTKYVTAKKCLEILKSC